MLWDPQIQKHMEKIQFGSVAVGKHKCLNKTDSQLSSNLIPQVVIKSLERAGLSRIRKWTGHHQPDPETHTDCRLQICQTTIIKATHSAKPKPQKNPCQVSATKWPLTDSQQH